MTYVYAKMLLSECLDSASRHCESGILSTLLLVYFI